MANLTTKELAALEDQLDFEKVLHCKYQEAAQECSRCLRCDHCGYGAFRRV